MLRVFPLLLLLVALVPQARAQTPDTTTAEPDLESVLEELTEDETGDPTQLLERLEDLRENPLDINAATADELTLIPAFNLLLAQRIVRYRLENGLFVSLPSLQEVEGITPEIYLAARPYLTIGEELDPIAARPSRFPTTPGLRTLFQDARYELFQRYGERLDLGRGYDRDSDRTTYLGSPARLYTRVRARAGRKLSFNFTAEKDPGERFEWNPDLNTYGYDYVSGHVAMTNYGRVRALVVGDFALEFGQGMVLWRGSGFGKSRDATRGLARRGGGVEPYGSTDENFFFRGVGATVAATPELYLSAFVSRRALDATVTEPDTLDDDVDVGLATGFSISGLHRTPTELAKKDALGETLVGGAATWEHGRGRLGVVGYHARFDNPLAPGDQPYRRFDFDGDEVTMASVFGDYLAGPVHLFGEVARAPGGAVGGVGGAIWEIARGSEVAALVRHYPRDFTSIHGYAFGERNGATQNETGIYLGTRLRLSRAWQVAAYFDQFQFPWLRFGVPRPSRGHEALLFVEWRPRGWVQVYAQGKTETKEVGATLTDANGRQLRGVLPETRQTLRLHGEYIFSRQLRIRARAEGARFVDQPDTPAEFGMLLYQDLRYQPLDQLRFDFRLAFFDTESYGARVYAFENDLLYVLTNPGFSGQGQRAYVLIQYEPIRNVTFWLKYAETRFRNVRTVGSGLDEVEGNALREFRAQVRVRF